VVNYGASKDYSITPATGYHVVDVLVDGTSLGALSSYSFTKVKANHSISVSFALTVVVVEDDKKSNPVPAKTEDTPATKPDTAKVTVTTPPSVPTPPIEKQVSLIVIPPVEVVPTVVVVPPVPKTPEVVVVPPLAPVVIPGDQVSTVQLPKAVEGASVKIVSVGKGLADANLANNNVNYEPTTSFSGKTNVTVETTVNGVTTQQVVQVTVLPVAPKVSESQPIKFTTSTINWDKSPNAVGYQVWVRGQLVCTTTSATNCQVPVTVGPETPVTVEVLGNDNTKTAVTPTYSIKKPLPALMVNFATAKSDLSADAKKHLQEVAAVIKKEGFTRLVITGHTDSQGGIDNNKLSLDRAQATVDYLKKLLPKMNIKVGAYASAKPIAPNTTAAGEAANRRAEISVW
jgi:outer membrane protein OmpA-like peptidoglycan-associated protein